MSFLREELGVAVSGVKWDVGQFKLWQSVRDDIILFERKQPVLAKGENGRYQVAVSAFHEQADETFKITGGSAIFTITSAIQFDQREMEKLKELWRAEILGSGKAKTQNPRFIPLNVRKGKAQVLINPQSGTPNQAHNDANIGTPGGTNSFLVELTELGAQEWVQGIRNGTAIPAGVKFMYEYLQMMPTVGAEVKLHGKRVFRHLSTALNASINYGPWGASAKIDTEWEKMTREGAIEVTFHGAGLAPEIEQLRQEITTTFLIQAQEAWFNILFEEAPDVEPATAGQAGGTSIFGLRFGGGANFALKWKKEEDVTDLTYTLKFEGLTWLKASMDADLVTLFSELDETYVTEVHTQQSFPASIVVDSDPELESVALSWTASEGKAPETPIFGSEGGNETYVVTSQTPNNVEIGYKAKVNFTEAQWPIIEDEALMTVADGGNQHVIKPSAWIGRNYIYMFVRDGDNIIPPWELTEDDYLVVNVTYNAPHLSRPIKTSSRITPLAPVEFSYPLDPNGGAGQATFSAFGVINNKLVRASDQPIHADEEGVFILASSTDIQLVSQDSVLPESDKLAQRLLANQARPQTTGDTSHEMVPETIASMDTDSAMDGDDMLKGTVIAVEYNSEGAALIIEDDNNNRQRVRLYSVDQADAFDDERKRVLVRLDKGYAKDIVVMLNP